MGPPRGMPYGPGHGPGIYIPLLRLHHVSSYDYVRCISKIPNQNTSLDVIHLAADRPPIGRGGLGDMGAWGRGPHDMHGRSLAGPHKAVCKRDPLLYQLHGEHVLLFVS